VTANDLSAIEAADVLASRVFARAHDAEGEGTRKT